MNPVNVTAFSASNQTISVLLLPAKLILWTMEDKRTKPEFQDLRKASRLKLLSDYSCQKLYIPTSSGNTKSTSGESKMKEHGCHGPCASTWRNESCSCLETAVALRLLHSTHYYQEILTFSIKGKRGGTERLTSKGVWRVYSSPWSCQLFPRYHLFSNSLPGRAAASPLESRVPTMSAFRPDSLLRRQRNWPDFLNTAAHAREQ